jgi:hypothetical protein
MDRALKRSVEVVDAPASETPETDAALLADNEGEGALHITTCSRSLERRLREAQAASKLKDDLIALNFNRAEQAEAKLKEREGYVLVPREPTRAMRKAGSATWVTNDREIAASATYRAMLRAAEKEKPLHGTDLQR